MRGEGEAGLDGQEVHFGAGSAGLMGALLSPREVRSLFLVTGRDSFDRSGAGEALRPLLGELAHVRFSGVRPNPDLAQVEAAVARFRSRPADAVLGVGGGSVLDVAKVTAVLAAQPGEPRDYLVGGRHLERPRACRLLLVPTTAGSGSEATRFATVYVDGRKRSLEHPALRADAVVVDPRLTRSQPPAVAASAGLDVLSQAAESSWSPRSNALSRRLAERALDLVLAHLAPACAGDDVARSEVSMAALLAGQAIDITRTTAAHAFAYPLTARFGVPHGLACALNLSWLVPFNCRVTESDAADDRGAGFVSARLADLLRRLKASGGEEARGRVLALVRGLGLSARLGELGVRPRDLGLLVAEGLASERAANNPRRLTAEAAHQGLRSLV